MNFRNIAAGFLLLFTFSATADERLEISPHFGYRWGGSIESSASIDSSAGQTLDLQDAQAYGLSIDFCPSADSYAKYELFWSRQESGLDLGTVDGANHVGLTVDEFMIGGVLESRQNKFRLYATGLVGATLFSPEDSESEVRFCISLGGGAKYFLLPNLALRADVRGFCTITESDSAFYSSGGVTVAHFSGSTLWQGEISAGMTLAF